MVRKEGDEILAKEKNLPVGISRMRGTREGLLWSLRKRRSLMGHGHASILTNLLTLNLLLLQVITQFLLQ